MVDHFSSSRNIMSNVESEVASSAVPTQDTILDPLIVGAQPALAHPECDVYSFKESSREDAEDRPHTEGCSHRRVRISCCNRTMLQHECMAHGECGKACFT